MIQKQKSVLVSPSTEDEKQQNSAVSSTQSYFLGDTSEYVVEGSYSPNSVSLKAQRERKIGQILESLYFLEIRKESLKSLEK